MPIRKARARPAPGAVDLTGEAVHWDLRGAMSYGDYLGLGTLLASQRPLSGAHDETLFIVIHQASELWMKLAFTRSPRRSARSARTNWAPRSR
ncbi:MAG TPA: tryptophan 2,3-dioxygenase family protein [Rhizomicrobium sp.]